MVCFVEFMIIFIILGFFYFDVIFVKYDIVINSSLFFYYRVWVELFYYCNWIFFDFEVLEYIWDIDRDLCEEMCFDNVDCVVVEYCNFFLIIVCIFREKNVNGFKIVNIKNS